MRYIPPFDILLRKAQISDAGDARRIALSYEDFLDILRGILAHVDIDEAWYLQANEDVGRGIKAGIIQSARQHFVDHGYFEGRRPGPLAVDEAFYLRQYPDVADDLRNGRVGSVQAHFDQGGYRDGRIPFNLGA